MHEPDDIARAPLIDSWMPEYDYVEHHETRVRARQAAVYRALMAMDVSAQPVARLLLGLRALPARLARRGQLRNWRTRVRLSLRDAPAFGFVILEERAPSEIVLGITGRFWRLFGGTLPSDRADFRGHIPPGAARAAWNFTLAVRGDATLLATETRIRCADAAARRAFGAYWVFVHPGSALLRRIALRMVKRAAEAGLADPTR